MSILLSKIKSYAMYFLAGCAAVFYFMLRVKTHQVESLKNEARKTKRLALEKQHKRQKQAIDALKVAEQEGKKRVKEATDRARSGRRDHFE